MTEEQPRESILRTLGDIALHKKFNIDIPEKDYPELATLEGCIAYVQARQGLHKHSQGGHRCYPRNDFQGDPMTLYLQALKRFQDLLEEAKQLNPYEPLKPLAMALATADEKGRPSVRTVYLAGVDERGLIFFTNRHSRKGRQLAVNPHAAVCFFWQIIEQQVQVEGAVEQVSEEEADAHWATRDHHSRLAAWASRQSEPLDSRQTLKHRLEEYQQQFDFEPIPRPPYWCGYRLVPERIEFWKTGWGHLHERECYQKSGDEWTATLLNP